jgi:hypothetical protein
MSTTGSQEPAAAHPRWWHLAILAAIALAVRVPLLPLHAYRWTGGTDTGEFKGWMQVIHEHGILNVFREAQTDYIGYHWMLWILTLLWEPFGESYSDTASGLHILFKMPVLLFEAALAICVYAATSVIIREMRRQGARIPPHATYVPLAAAAIIALHPASLYDGALWGQTDALTAAAMLGSLLLLFQQRPVEAGFVWGAGFVMKPQPIVIAPLLAAIAFDRGDWRTLARMTVGGLAAGTLLTLPWILHGDLRRIGGIYKSLVYEDLGRLSGNSWNLWWIPDVAGDPRPDDALLGPLTYRRAGTLLQGAATILAVWYAWSKPSLRRALVASAYSTFAFYMLSVSSHDRYLYPLFALLLPVLIMERRWLLLYAPLSVTFVVSLVISAPPVEGWAHNWLESPLTLAGASLNLSLFAVFTALIVRGISPSELRAMLAQPFQRNQRASAPDAVCYSDHEV